MNEATAEEHPVNFERSEGVDVTVQVDNIGRKLFRADGMLTRLLQRIKGMLSMAHQDRGPTDYDEDADTKRLLIGIIKEQAKRGNGSHYHEGGSGLLKWILGVLATLTVAVIVGGVTVYGRFTSLETKVEEWKTSAQRQIDQNAVRLDRLENRRP